MHWGSDKAPGTISPGLLKAHTHVAAGCEFPKHIHEPDYTVWYLGNCEQISIVLCLVSDLGGIGLQIPFTYWCSLK